MKRFTRLLKLGLNSKDYPHVSVVKLSGVIAAGAGGPRSPQNRRLINLERVDKWLTKAFSESLRPAAVALCINSPGGSAVQSDLIHRRVRQLAGDTGIPIFTFAEDVAASGGYWLMCAGDELYALNTSIVGSVGVIAASFGLSQLIDRWGVERRIQTAGSEKSLMDPFVPKDPEQERKANQLGLIDGIEDMQSAMRKRFGKKVLFRLCSEPPRPALGDALGFSLSLPWRLPATYDLVREASQAVMDAAHERTLYARCGL
ncbi:hypothetical protein WJX73_001157 [Symbiochloris irregularis]|uniref:Peptidase S49 domain-containing protein n=1 Tax=Symbiochloris irregularis TaxID=706552 RepID=A0AAW1PTN5_9CHLO